MTAAKDQKGPPREPSRRKAARYHRQCLLALLIISCLFAVSQSAQEGAGAPKVHGLYLGMPLTQAVKAAADLVDLTHYELQPFNLEAYKFRSFHGNAHEYWFSDTRSSVVSPLVFATDGQKKLTFISMGRTLAERLFPSQETAPEDFVQRFATTHGLPPLTPFQTEHKSPLPNLLPDSGWRFRSPSGYRITIYSNGDLDLETVAPQR